MEPKTIVITGASAGVGAATAHRFAEKGNRLILLARRKNKLEALQKDLRHASVNIYELDVSSRESVEKIFQRIEKEVGAVDVLVNNAGLALGLDSAQESDLDEWEQMMDVNVKGLTYCTHCVLPGMVKRNRGHIINIGSTAGIYPYPGASVYCGTKAFVHQFSKALRSDLLGTKVRVSCVQPGLIGGTEFSTTRFRGDEAKAKSVYEKMEPLLAEDVAEVIYFCNSVPDHVNLNSVEMMPVIQACGPLLVHRAQSSV